MKKCCGSLVASLLLCLHAAADGGADGGKNIGLACVGDFDPTLVERIRGFAQRSLMMPVVMIEAKDVKMDSLDDVGRSASAWLDLDHAMVVVLFMPEEDLGGHGVVRREEHTAVVNARAMLPEPSDPEKYARRLERQVMRSVGLLLGLDFSPNPRSAMWPYKTLEQLDRIGRNFDPPWLLKAQRAARERGIKILSRQWPPAGSVKTRETAAKQED